MMFTRRLSTFFSDKPITLGIWLALCGVIISAFFHLYNLQNNYMFLGDQGRDVSIVADIFRKNDPVFIGPVMSIGNIYLGPLYYYFMLPWLFLTYPDPIGPSVAIAFLGILTVWLVYSLGKTLVGERTALLASWIYLLSAVYTMHSRFSWNPNPAPFVSLILVYSLAQTNKKPLFWLVVSVCVSILIQLHYVTLLSGAAAAIIWVWQFIRQHTQRKKILLITTACLLIFATSLIPLVLFDFKHGWLNAQAFAQLLTGEGSFTSVAQTYSPMQKIWIALSETHGRSLHVFFEVLFGQYRTLQTTLLVGIVATLSWILYRSKKTARPAALPYLIVFAGVGILGLGFYRGNVYDHYIAYLFPISTLLIATVLMYWERYKVGKFLVLSFLLAVLYFNTPRFPFRDAAWKPSDVKATADSILEKVSPGEKYNIILVSDSRDYYGANYRYFLSTSSKPPIPVGSNETVDRLYIIDETKGRIKVTDLPTYEIVVFSNKEPIEEFTAPNDGPIISILSQTRN